MALIDQGYTMIVYNVVLRLIDDRRCYRWIANELEVIKTAVLAINKNYQSPKILRPNSEN